MKFLLLLLLTIANAMAGTWDYRVADSVEMLNSKSWISHPDKGNVVSREYEGYLEYRTFINSKMLMHSKKVYLGKIGDADRVYLNGIQIGQTGSFPPNFSYDMDSERTYFLPENLITKESNELRIVVYSKFLVNKGFSPSNFQISNVNQMDTLKYSNELWNDLSRIIIPLLCLVLAAVSFPLLAPRHQWNTQVMIFSIGLSSAILGICRGRILYHFFDMLPVYKLTLSSSIVTIWLITLFMTRHCRSSAKFLPTVLGALLIGSVLLSPTLTKAAFVARVWFHFSPIFLLFALYGSFRSYKTSYFKICGLLILILTSINDNLNDLRIISTVSLLQIGLGTFISCMILDQLLSLKASWEKYFMKEAQLEIDAAVGRQAIQIAHDLRSPLEAIKSSLFTLKFNAPDDEHAVLSGVTRINQICNTLLKSNDTSNQLVSIAEIRESIEQVTQELRTIHKESSYLEIQTTDDTLSTNLHFTIDLINMKRTLCNLITNSIEACDKNGKILVATAIMDNSLTMVIEDTGLGISADSETVFERGFTTKPNGNGLGLSSAKSFVESLGGSISLKRLEGKTSVTLTIPSLQADVPSETKNANQIVLIDDDPLVRFTWKRQAKKQSISVQAFESFNSFMKVKDNFCRQTPIYIDSNLGEVKGEILSQQLVQMGFKKVILTTGMPTNQITNRKWISAIVGKSFDSAILLNN